MSIRVAVVGAGAAGCFASINLKRMAPEIEVSVFESGRIPLAKVSVTGGGRCNLTNSFLDIGSLAGVYPRGGRLMSRLFKEFGPEDAFKWFSDRGVELLTQPDGRVFPVSGDAMEIVGLLLNEIERLGIVLHLNSRITSVASLLNDYDAVVVTIGGASSPSSLSLMDGLDITVVKPVPSLFSFRIDDLSLRELSGMSVTDVETGIPGTKFRSEGPLLITDWGLSGPAILRLSSYAAREIAERQYHIKLFVKWAGGKSHEEIIEMLTSLRKVNPNRQISNAYPQTLNSRIWSHLLERAGMDSGRKWLSLQAKDINRLTEVLSGDVYDVVGRNKFKGEFVTCGGVALTSINPATLESRQVPSLYFAGEILDIDGVTGGFNLQAAWTTGYVVANSLARRFS